MGRGKSIPFRVPGPVAAAVCRSFAMFFCQSFRRTRGSEAGSLADCWVATCELSALGNWTLSWSWLTGECYPMDSTKLCMCYHNGQRVILMSCSASSNKLEEREAGSPRCGMDVFFLQQSRKLSSRREFQIQSVPLSWGGDSDAHEGWISGPTWFGKESQCLIRTKLSPKHK